MVQTLTLVEPIWHMFQNISKTLDGFIYTLDTVLEVSPCNRTTVETVQIMRVEPKVINLSKVVLLRVKTSNTVSKQFRLYLLLCWIEDITRRPCGTLF